MIPLRLIAIVTVILGSLVLGIYVSSASFVPTTQESLSSNASNVSTEMTVTNATSCSSTTSVLSSSATAESSNSVAVKGNFSFSPSAPILIKSVQATRTFDGNNGDTFLTFVVSYENIGSYPVYVITGCGSALEAKNTNGSVIQKVPAGPRCLCAEVMKQLSPNGNQNSSDPGCWSSYGYKLIQQSGGTTVAVELVLHWTSSAGSPNSNTTIRANFVF